MGITDVIAGFFASSMIIFFIIRLILIEILHLNIGRKKKYRKVTQEQTFLQRILLSYLKRYINKHRFLFKVYIVLYYIYISLNLIYLMLIIFYIIQAYILHINNIIGFEPFKIFKYIFYIKFYLIDIPISLFFMIKSGHDKIHGGVKLKL